MDALRVLHVSPYGEEASAYGGIPRAVTALVRALARNGHRVTLATTDAGTAAARAEGPSIRISEGVHLRTFPNVSNAAAYHFQMFLPRGLDGYLDGHAREFDVAHLHGCHHVPGVIAARALNRAGVPWVLSPHGIAGFIERRRAAKRIFDALVGHGVRREAAVVTALGERERRDLIALGVSDARIRMLPSPVDPDELLAVDGGGAIPAPGIFRARLAIGKAPLVLFLGTLTPRKRLDSLLRALATAGLADAQLVIAGNDMGAGAAARRLAAVLGVAPRVRFLGLLTGRERVAALRDADVVACASEHESFGLVPLEALMVGTPAVAADDSGAADIIRGTRGALLVRPGDVTALARAIRTILDDVGALRAAAAQATAVVRDRCSPGRIAQAAVQLYDEVLATRADGVLA